MKSALKNTIYALLYYTGLWLLFRYFNRNKVAVLMYHGVTDKEINCWTQLPLEKFKRQMKFIGQYYHPISLEIGVDILKIKKAEIKYPMIVTFDDGFKNNRTIAYPILKKYQIPATIFLTTSFVDKTGPYGGLLWTDYILMLLRNSKTPEFELADIGLGKIDLSSMEKRHLAKERICGKLKKIGSDEKNAAIKAISEKLDWGISEHDYAIFEGLNWDDINTLAKEGLIDFGAHTINHEILSRLEKDKAILEIKGSKDAIEKRIGKKVATFAYPNGTRADFTHETKAIAQEYFDCALTTIEGLNQTGCNLYEIKRINIGKDLSMIEFKLAVSGVIDFIRKLLPSDDKAYN
jgi:peptidoglycan/xylan/chitin deacetylase (PgdA/CDA1 family)